MSRPNYPEPIIVGYTVAAIEGAETLLAPPKAPGNYGEDAAAKWLSDPSKGGKAWQKLLDESAFSKVTGRITSIFAVDPLQGLIFDSSLLTDPSISPAVAFATWLHNERPNCFRNYPNRFGLEPNRVAIYGLRAKEFVRVLGIQCILEGHAVPIGLWYQNEDCFDPYDMVVESERRGSLLLKPLLAGVGIVTPEEWEPHQHAETDAKVATELIHIFGLLPEYDEQKLYSILQDSLTPVDAIEGEEAAEAAEDGEYAEDDYGEGGEEYAEADVEELAATEADVEEYADGVDEDSAEEYADEPEPAPAPAPAPRRRSPKRN